MPENYDFHITVEPSEDDPHNWCWMVRWTHRGRRRAASGPAYGATVLPGPESSKNAAERYADTLAANLPKATTYNYQPTEITHA